MQAKKAITLILLCLALWHVSASAYMLSKAWLSHYLITQSWQKTLKDKKRHKPWSWADTYPIAQVSFPRLNESSVILEGASGRNLAFSATHLSASGMPDENKTMIVSGHRDSHFSFLKNIQLNDKISVQTVDGNYQYHVTDLRIVDSNDEKLNILNKSELVLSTCYPFDALMAGGNLRYVVKSTLIKNSKN